ncbi:PAS domain-containing protein [Paraburkholderia sp. CNPSo 3274]|uniref:PAS domain-containing protein n=1 Tax=Paraburkholderia sp. CNPSo 3274 TaxID=2940932 RepID=UPI0020B855B7|nr:PAS domain-containing protein [Paraburkholderia sp. CNPSo 3274]MCP3709943.1 PAS domain-containing protein [Paraburkholderia sp. CNPSo 3274]
MDTELSRTVDALPGLVWTAFPDGRIEFVNRRWCEYTGLSVDQASGEGWQTAFHPDDQPALLEAWRTVVASGEQGDAEARMRRFDGTYRWFACRASPITDAAGEVVKWCGINSDIEDRKQTEAALRVQEQRFELIVDSLPTRVVLFAPDGDVLHANRHTLEYAGATLDELRAWKTNGLTHPDDRDAVVARFHASISTGEPYDAESRHRSADGVYRWFRVQGFPLRDNERRIALWYFLQTDIDDRKRAEALLAGENRLLEMIATGQPLPTVLDALCRLVEEIASDCVCRVTFQDARSTACRHLGSPGLPKLFLPRPGTRAASHDSGPLGMAVSLKAPVIVPDVASDVRWTKAWRERSLAHGLRSCWATPILSRTNEVLGTFTLFRSHTGNPTPLQHDLIAQLTHIASIAIERAHSIAARQQVDERLRQSAALMAKVEQLSSSGSFCWCPQTGSITWSEQLYGIFGIEPGVPITLDMIAARFHPGDRLILDEMIERAQAGKDLELEHRLLLPDGSVRHIHIQAHPTRDSQGGLDYIGAAQDMTERRESEGALLALRAELAHLSRVNSQGALTASIAHEINQPLAGIVTNASTGLRMLSAQPPNVEGALETVRRTIRDGHRASEVMARLRALFSKQAVTTDAVDLVEATHEVIELLQCEIRNKRIVLHVKAAEDLPPVTGDRIQLQQVVLSLLLNAVEAMSGVDERPRQMRVSIEHDDGDCVRLAVTDSGVGIDPQNSAKLFDPFFTTTREDMGISLAVSRRIIESHGGRLWASSNADPGATFTFSIPLRTDSMAAADQSVPTGQPARADAEQTERNL